MAQNVFRQIDGGSGIFKDENYLRPEYLPEQMPCREREMKEIASYLQGAAKGKVPPSMLLYGKPGTGKTTMAKLLLKQLSDVSSKPMPVYINCWENFTRFGILSQLVNEYGDMLPRRGIAIDEVAQRIAEMGPKSGKILVVVLDEVDRLVASGGEEKVLYDLSRAKEALGIDASVIAITNDEELAVKLDPRIRSSLTNNSIKFESYNPIQLKQILKERAKLAFFPGVWDDDVIGICAAIGAKAGGDARVSINVLWSAGKKAESQGAKKISVEHVQKVKESSVSNSSTLLKRKEDLIEEGDEKILQIVKNAKDGIISGEIYKKMNADENDQRTIRNHLEKMEKAGILESEKSTDGFGKTRKWRLRKTDKE